MPNGFESFLRGAQLGEQRRANLLARQRQQQFQDIMGAAYTPEEVGPMQPGIERAPAEFEREQAIDALLGGGFIQEAQQLAQPLGAQAPSAVQTYEYWKGLPEAEQQQMLLTMRGQQIRDIGGVPHVVSPTGEPTALSTLQVEAAARAEKKRQETLAASAAKQAEQSISLAGKTRSNVANLDEVVRLIEKEGAMTGPVINMFPSFRASSVELDNMQKQLGLDVIGAVTFGALSKGELDLALSKALPTNLTGDALVDWAKRKKASQEKLAKYFEDQAIYLSKPGATQAGWVEAQRTMQQEQPGAPSPGDVQGGYRFKGGNPADPNAWEKI